MMHDPCGSSTLAAASRHTKIATDYKWTIVVLKRNVQSCAVTFKFLVGERPVQGVTIEPSNKWNAKLGIRRSCMRFQFFRVIRDPLDNSSSVSYFAVSGICPAK
jgi:hypothetical protein